MLDDLDLNSIEDERARELIIRLLNLLEGVTADLRAAQVENQRQRDEIARLKGEQGKPKIKPNKPRLSGKDISSEKERRKPKKWSKSSKIEGISIDREQVVKVDRDSLPPDAEFKGYEDVVVQDVIFRTDNVLFHKEKFHSLSEGKTYGTPAARLQRSVWTRNQSADAGVLLRGADERAEGGRDIAQCGS